ncbi:uncharacterized protein MYCGRDRAFT_104412 [Zymoseptoria tritici IPO323]|uniref:Uncharacterized protein n=1 Tax=Zymoseptoria tritici (strain CBS 115943 / IPO323) TaxID=336722 RepID=F9XBC1_ZYMTI|nr:uncharacterized protein MYCGRDRAFT_104412 [Zymoseptoria tritici IPO323]EGP87676.1 hypothetical protein MYCGRDRAFT_104412 [Zymoseptoria tritici IPO323]
MPTIDAIREAGRRPRTPACFVHAGALIWIESAERYESARKNLHSTQGLSVLTISEELRFTPTLCDWKFSPQM